MATGIEGYDYSSVTSVTEVIAVSSKGEVAHCNQFMGFDGLFDSPVELKQATGGLLRLPVSLQEDPVQNYYQSVPVFCGGNWNYALASRVCYRLGAAFEDPIGVLIQERSQAASVSINNGSTLWVTGGEYQEFNGLEYFSNPLDTTEYLDVIYEDKDKVGLDLELDSMSLISTLGPRLPTMMRGHCLEMISDKLVILYGGYNYAQEFSKAWTFDLDKQNNPDGEDWVEIASMSLARDRHSCGVLRDALSPKERKIVVAAGGCAGGGAHFGLVIRDSVELLHANGEVLALKWATGPQMPEPLCGAASATIKDGTRLFVVGGVTDFTVFPEEKSNSVYYLQCRLTLCEWTTVDLELLSPRSGAVAMIVPLIDKRNFSLEETTLPFPCQGGMEFICIIYIQVNYFSFRSLPL